MKQAMKRLSSIAVLGTAIGVMGAAFPAGCGGSPPTTTPSPTPDKVWCQIHHATCLTADLAFTHCEEPWIKDGKAVFTFLYTFGQGDPTSPSRGVKQDPYAYADMTSYKPAPGEISTADMTTFGPGRFFCDKLSATRTPEIICAEKCGTSRVDPAGKANPAAHPPLPGTTEPYCVGFSVVGSRGAATEPGTCVSTGTGSTSQPLLAMPGAPFSPDLYVGLHGQGTGTNTVTIGGASGDIPVVGGYMSLKLPDPRCKVMQPCVGRLNALELVYAGIIYTVDGDDFHINDLTVDLPDPLDVTIQPVPGSSSLRIDLAKDTVLHASAIRDGLPQAMAIQTPDVGHITYNPDTGVVTADVAWTSTVNGTTISGTTLTSSTTVANRPPNANAGADLTVAAVDASCAAQVSLTGVASDPDGDLVAEAWALGSTVISHTDTASSTLAIGDHVLRFSALDAHAAQALDEVAVHVTDGTLPVFVNPPDTVTLHACSPGPTQFHLPAPDVKNPCSPDTPSLGGVVTAINGSPVAIPVVNGAATLPAGVHRVRWTVTNPNGSSTFDQQLRVVSEPTLYASDSLSVENRAQITAPGGLFGTVMNAGAARTNRRGRPLNSTVIGDRADVGDVLSSPFLDLRDRSHVHGFVIHTDGLRRGRNALVDGGVLALADFQAAVVSWNPPVFSGGDDIQVRAGQTLTLAPGSYKELEVRRRGRVILSNGTYAFNELEVEDDATLVVPDRSAGVALYASKELKFQADVIGADGAAAPLFVGYAGTREVKLDEPFWGVVVAPSSELTLTKCDHDGHRRSDDERLYRGRFYARELEVDSKVKVEHDGLLCTSDP